jgi:hypothetical protein
VLRSPYPAGKSDNMGPFCWGALEAARIRYWLGGVRYQKNLPEFILPPTRPARLSGGTVRPPAPPCARPPQTRAPCPPPPLSAPTRQANSNQCNLGIPQCPYLDTERHIKYQHRCNISNSGQQTDAHTSTPGPSLARGSVWAGGRAQPPSRVPHRGVPPAAVMQLRLIATSKQLRQVRGL